MCSHVVLRDRVRMSTLYEGKETKNEHRLDDAIKKFNAMCTRGEVT